MWNEKPRHPIKNATQDLPEVRRNEQKQAPVLNGSHSYGRPHGFVWETSYFPSFITRAEPIPFL